MNAQEKAWNVRQHTAEISPDELGVVVGVSWLNDQENRTVRCFDPLDDALERNARGDDHVQAAVAQPM